MSKELVNRLTAPHIQPKADFCLFFGKNYEKKVKKGQKSLTEL